MTTIMHLHPLTARALLEHSQRSTERLRARRETVALARSGGWSESHIKALIEASESMTEANAMILHNRALSDAANNEADPDPEHWVTDEQRERAAQCCDWFAERPWLCTLVAAAVVAGAAVASAIWPHHWWGV